MTDFCEIKWKTEQYLLHLVDFRVCEETLKHSTNSNLSLGRKGNWKFVDVIDFAVCFCIILKVNLFTFGRV